VLGCDDFKSTREVGNRYERVGGKLKTGIYPLIFGREMLYEVQLRGA
jgi:hypothetical protein